MKQDSDSKSNVDDLKDMVRLGLALLTRPKMIPAALRAAAALAPRRWWAKAPFLPIPDKGFVEFRQATANGDPNSRIDLEDFFDWLQWRQLHERR